MNEIAAPAGTDTAALYTFFAYIAGLFALAWVANRLLKGRNFLSEYFLGSRRLGVWAFALTFAATSSSGGSFTGFPAKIYVHGWVMALWIASYMLVPICMMGMLGKRLNQVARKSGAITVPDVLRDRFRSPAFGLIATALLVFFLAFNLVAQFKAGSLILKTLLDGVEAFHSSALALAGLGGDISWLQGVEPEYLICLLAFGIVVIAYTAYGGFHAVVWTDVMQGVVMVAGVLIMLPLALYQVGGLEQATKEIARMVPPRLGTVTVALSTIPTRDHVVPSGTWLATGRSPDRGGDETRELRLFRTHRTVVFFAGQRSLQQLPVTEIRSPSEKARLIQQVALATELQVSDLQLESYAYGAETPGTYVSGPGPSRTSFDGFLPLSLAFSFFFMWAIAGTGQPTNYVRLMAFKNARTLRKAILTVAVYYSLIYFPLVIIFCCARILMPGMEGEADRIMPAMAVHLTKSVGVGWLGGLLVAAPFAAVMSTVDSLLLMISSSLVRDVYQRNVNVNASPGKIRHLAYICTLAVGVGAMLASLNPPQFLQDIIVYTGSGLAACFLAPTVYALYWSRANVAGCIAGMGAGFFAHLSLYVAGAIINGSFFIPHRLFNLDPIILGLLVSFVAVPVVCWRTAPPAPDLVNLYFHRD